MSTYKVIYSYTWDERRKVKVQSRTMLRVADSKEQAILDTENDLIREVRATVTDFRVLSVLKKNWFGFWREV